ncbi:ABC transporter permease [Fimbriiglobus ruber]|uniref:Ribose ABC transport system, permease protein RbsC n=1 Tax=Fimbriiglobus ruber TaxID=1908690 RepID=A0A225DH45_9BACT|nr:ABC transporter permease [Fimbriiglobus ruber]OWK40831.1 Ribose ABC transport system, permease protein RbsC [Fimbriiglobus ruber]
MSGTTGRARIGKWASEYSILLVLAALCAFFSAATVAEQYVDGPAGGEELAGRVVRGYGAGVKVAVVAGTGRDDAAFADALDADLRKAGATVVVKTVGQPHEVRTALRKAAGEGAKPDVIATNRAASHWLLWDNLGEKVPGIGAPKLETLPSYRWPNFLKSANLFNIANQIAVFAIIAAGMTLVIITAGIDLSVGSLIALSAVTATFLIRKYAGAEQAAAPGMIASCLAAVALCGIVGTMTGFIITQFSVPPFIMTLGTMLMARGVASILSERQSIYQVPDSFVRLGIGADLAGIPNAVVLMAALYVVMYVVMTRTTFGRYVYAVGGNPEAARLAGVRVAGVTVLVYAISGALAGLGGVILASRLKSGSPTYGEGYELYAIAAVVLGGTSLSGGAGKVVDTLIGAFVIAVIQNGMNMMNVESDTQSVVLGAIIVGAVLVDRIKKRK